MNTLVNRTIIQDRLLVIYKLLLLIGLARIVILLCPFYIVIISFPIKLIVVICSEWVDVCPFLLIETETSQVCMIVKDASVFLIMETSL